jgi:hypothetical protein
MKILLSKQHLDDFPMKNKEYLVDVEKNTYWYDLKAGRQEYRMYSYFSTLFNDTTILDIGTYYGNSAVALSHNKNNKVISYDIIDNIKNDDHVIYTIPNIEFRIKNVLEDLNEDMIKHVKIVMIDINHYGNIEEIIINKLRTIGFQGMIILDDIHHPIPHINKFMERFWASIEEEKYDVTKYAHHSGTGIVLFGDDIQIDFEI